MRRVAATALTVAVTACGGPQPGPASPKPASPGPTKTGRASTSSGPATHVPSDPPPPSSSVVYAPDATATPSSSAGPEPTTQPPGQPAPTSSGPLDERALPNPVGPFVGRPTNATEGEYHPNGTWVHARPGGLASFQAMPPCGGGGVVPQASHALVGTYADPAGVPGNGLALEFTTPGDASAWFTAYTTRLAACSRTPGSPVVITDLRNAPSSFTARRQQAYDNTGWTEAGRVKGTGVVLVLIGGLQHDPAVVADAVDRV